MSAGGTNKLMLAITCPFGTTCYAVGAVGAIWVSNTAGASWSNLSLSTLQWFTGIACPPPGSLTCYVTGTTGPIRYTSNGFSSVSSQTNPSGATLRALACLSSSTCLAAGSGGAMVETTSSGGTWTSLNSGTAYDLKAVACPSSSTCYAVGAGSTILQTASAGSTWSWTPEYMQGTPYYYGLDGHGSVVNLTDQSGSIQNQYRYDPYGNSLARTENATIANPWQYAGGYYEAESGLYLLGVRYYDPNLGLFLQVDPLGSSMSEYSYAGDDPCNNSDPSGLRTCYHYNSPADTQAMASSLKQQANSWSNKAIAMGAIAGGLGVAAGVMSLSVLWAPAGAIVGVTGAIVFGGPALAADLTARQDNDTANELSSFTHGYYSTYDPGTSGGFLGIGGTPNACQLGDTDVRPTTTLPIYGYNG